MNIQINCNENITESELRYIYHNLKNYIQLYEETKNNYSYYKYNGCSKHWEINSKGNFLYKPNIKIKCNGKTMYFKVGK